MANPKLGLAKDLFEDMGRKVADAQQAGDEEDTKVVDEIESLCMNCHANVSIPLPFSRHNY
jgi:zinc finger protein